MPYVALPAGDYPEGREATEMDQRTFGERHRLTATHCILAVFTALVLFLVGLSLIDSQPSFHGSRTCGNSSAEARSLGCSFDVMSFAWLPAHCFDRELTDEFLALRDWEWFLDIDGIHAVALDSIIAGGYPQLYVTQEYHLYHCTFMWRKMHRAVLRGGPLDSYIGNFNHTTHCARMLLDRETGLADINTEIYTKYVNCPIK